jgi:hypothetical protein
MGMVFSWLIKGEAEVYRGQRLLLQSGKLRGQRPRLPNNP